MTRCRAGSCTSLVVLRRCWLVVPLALIAARARLARRRSRASRSSRTWTSSRSSRRRRRNPLFADGRAMRPPVAGHGGARRRWRDDAVLDRGRGGRGVGRRPSRSPVTEQLLRRGPGALRHLLRAVPRPGRLRRRHRWPSAPTRLQEGTWMPPVLAATPTWSAAGRWASSSTRSPTASATCRPTARRSRSTTAGRSSPTCGRCSAARTRPSRTCRRSCAGSCGRGGTMEHDAPTSSRRSGTWAPWGRSCGAGLALARAPSACWRASRSRPRAPGGWRRFFFAYLVSFAFVLSLALGALFFVLLQHLTRAGWSVVVRRLAEALAADPAAAGAPRHARPRWVCTSSTSGRTAAPSHGRPRAAGEGGLPQRAVLRRPRARSTSPSGSLLARFFFRSSLRPGRVRRPEPHGPDGAARRPRDGPLRLTLTFAAFDLADVARPALVQHDLRRLLLRRAACVGFFALLTAAAVRAAAVGLPAQRGHGRALPRPGQAALRVRRLLGLHRVSRSTC